MKYLYRMDQLTSRHMPATILLCAAVGIALPRVFSPLGALVPALFFLVTFSNSLSAGFREMGQVILHPLPVLVVFFILHVLMPVLAFGTGSLLFPDEPYFITGLVLEFAVPTGVLALVWIGLCRGNTPMALSIILLDTLLAPLVIPTTLRLLLGSVVEIDAAGMIRDLLYMIAIPALIGMALYQATGGKISKTLKPRLSPFSKICMLIIFVCNAADCSKFLYEIDRSLILLIFSVFGLCVLSFFISFCAARFLKLDFPSIQTMTLAGGMRNISAGSVLAMQYFPSESLFPVAFTPMFLHLVVSLVVQTMRRTALGRADQAAYERHLEETPLSP
ncbi:Predicted Na+-dependent transporter [Oscillibacter sp. PC13]|uniref:bile acid:sodium symporter family protein n=1 Tax=Oscillibacter sp. PC13 TaxID=1855299 RepID=UPI0008F160C7|nr:bile acid:sodium symporter family protein [Oscillibacter sp. PC13]SFP78631.1 Predicted Na+-dependent transporter [Oscillibacter sp. PC13]